MPTFDPGFGIFNDDAFSMISLTNTVNKSPYVPNYLARLGIFDEKGVPTTSVWIEEESGTVALVPTVPRNGPPTNNTPDKRKAYALSIPCLKLEDDIHADEVQNIRAFGSEMGLKTMQTEVNTRFARMNRNIEATLEYHRMGAIKGVILDADGTTTLYNLFTIFGLTQDSTDFVLGTTTTEILDKCTTVRDNIQTELGSEGGDDIEVLCLCGASFFSKLIKHTKVTDVYKQWRAWMGGEPNYGSDPMTMDLRYRGFKFGDIRFVQYRGSIGGVSYIATGEAYAFPVNVPGLFHTDYGPATFIDTVNQPGLPRYARMLPDASGRNEKVTAHLQSNPVNYCNRPKVLQKLTTSN